MNQVASESAAVKIYDKPRRWCDTDRRLRNQHRLPQQRRSHRLRFPSRERGRLAARQDRSHGFDNVSECRLRPPGFVHSSQPARRHRRGQSHSRFHDRHDQADARLVLVAGEFPVGPAQGAPHHRLGHDGSQRESQELRPQLRGYDLCHPERDSQRRHYSPRGHVIQDGPEHPRVFGSQHYVNGDAQPDSRDADRS